MLKLKILRFVPVLLVLAPAVAFAQPTILGRGERQHSHAHLVRGIRQLCRRSGRCAGWVDRGVAARVGHDAGGPAVPPGTYFVRVRDAASNALSNETTVSVAGTGCPAPPLPPSLVVRSVGFNVTVELVAKRRMCAQSYTLPVRARRPG